MIAKALPVEGLAAPSSDLPLQVYPNPARDKISLIGLGNETAVYDALGRRVLSLSHLPGEVVSLGIAHLPPGVYVVRSGGRSLLLARY